MEDDGCGAALTTPTQGTHATAIIDLHGHGALDWDSGPWKEEHGVARPAPRKKCHRIAESLAPNPIPDAGAMGMKS